MRGLKRLLAALVVCGLATVTQAREALPLRIEVKAGKHDRGNVPVSVSVPLPTEIVGDVDVVAADGKRLPGQLVPPALLDPQAAGKGQAVLWFILDSLKAGERATFEVRARKSMEADPNGLRWSDEAGVSADLSLGKRPVLRYMYAAHDPAPAKRDLNNKPYHHLFDPSDGARLITKGEGGHDFHHKGLYYGFTRCLFEGGPANTWYCHDGESQAHRGEILRVAGSVVGRHRLAIDWNDRQGKAFAAERRELTAFALKGGTLVEFASRLRSRRGEVALEGDSHHAGFQFRAANEVAEREKEKLVYFLRPEGKGDAGETVNQPMDDRVTNRPWNVMSFVLGKDRYSVLYVDHPANPRPSIYSERTYGRFGCWPGRQVLREEGAALDLRYRIWAQRGEMTAEEARQLAAAFAEPPAAAVLE